MVLLIKNINAAHQHYLTTAMYDCTDKAGRSLKPATLTVGEPKATVRVQYWR